MVRGPAVGEIGERSNVLVVLGSFPMCVGVGIPNLFYRSVFNLKERREPSG